MTALARRRRPLLRRALAGLCLAAGGGGGAVAAAPPGTADDAGAVSLLLPSAPGGANALLATALAEALGPRLGRAVALRHRPSPRGAGHGIEALLRAPGDGSWLGFAQSSHVLLPALFPGLGFDPVADFEPVAGWCASPYALLVRADFPARDLREFFAVLRGEPGQHRYGSGGPASTQTLASERLLRAGRTSAGALHFAGSGPARAALAAGRVSFVLEMLPAALEATAPGRAGGLRLLAHAAAARLPAHPHVPTFAESAGSPELAAFGLDVWGVVLAPPATPEAVLEPVREAIRAAQADPAVAHRLGLIGSAPLALGTGPELRRFLAAQRAELERLARELAHG